MSKVKIISDLAKLGYTKFKSNKNFIHSTLTYLPATISNLEEDIIVYSFQNEEGETFYMWSNVHKILKKVFFIWNNAEDKMNFEISDFYINEDSFLIPIVKNYDDLYNYNEENTFIRPIINLVDSRTDLGYKKFIITDAGILFSIHEKLEHKLLDYDTILPNEIKIIKEKTLIGTLDSSFEVTACHLIPIDSGFWK
jgi:hypothetical protein